MFGMGVIIPLLSGKIGKKTLAPMNVMSLKKMERQSPKLVGKQLEKQWKNTQEAAKKRMNISRKMSVKQPRGRLQKITIDDERRRRTLINCR